MTVHTLPYGPLSSNMYVIGENGSFYIVDPSVSPDACFKNVPGFDLSCVKAVFVTHAHFDHIYRIEEWQKECGCPIYLSEEERRLMGDPDLNCSSIVGLSKAFAAQTIDISCDGIKSAGLDLSVIRTPGHTSGSVCYLVRSEGMECLFSGDTVFAGSVGRTDFPTGSVTDMLDSVQRIKSLGRNILIYPGHGPDSDLFTECRSNPYFF